MKSSSAGNYNTGVKEFFKLIMTADVLGELAVKHHKTGDQEKDAIYKRAFRSAIQQKPTVHDAIFMAPKEEIPRCKEAFEEYEALAKEFEAHEKMRQKYKTYFSDYNELIHNTTMGE